MNTTNLEIYKLRKSYEKWSNNIKLILGDAHLEALDDIRCFKSLKYVGGTIFYKGKQFHSLQACRKFLAETNNV